MNATVGSILGWTIVIFYSLTVMNYIIKFINRRWGKKITQNERLKGPFRWFMSFIVKNHRYFGFITIAAILGHFYIQYNRWGFVPSGALAAALMTTQASLGAYGTYVKKKKKGPWLLAHRTIAVLLLFAVLFHLITVKLKYGG